jgi:hypothetical protein
MFDEPAMPSKRSGQSAAMSVSVESESERYTGMVWFVEMFEWKTSGLGNGSGKWVVIRLWKQVPWTMCFLI